ncbi:MAG: CHAT domain-containing protein [Thermosynechococcaceae cyanobacterium]
MTSHNLDPFVSSVLLTCRHQFRAAHVFVLLSPLCLGLLWAPAKASTQPDQSAASQQSSPAASAENLVQQGQVLYESGQFMQAAQLFQQAASASNLAGDPLRRAMALGNLSLSYQRLGQWLEAEQSITEGLALVEKGQDSQDSNIQVSAQLLDIQGRLELERGQPQGALKSWQQAAATYTQLGESAKVLQSQINQAQAQQSLGQYRQARSTLLAARTQLTSEPDGVLKATGLRSLGNVFRAVGDLQLSQEVLEESLTMVAQDPQGQVNTRLSLGQTLREQGESARALALYQEAANSTDSLELRTRAQLQELSIYVESQEFGAAEMLWPKLVAQIKQLPPSRTAVYASIFLSETLSGWGEGSDAALRRPSPPSLRRENAQLLATAIGQAQRLGDPRAQSLALGTLGKMYEQSRQSQDAMNLTEQALLLSQSLDMADLSYRWQWQLGRLQKSQGETASAIASYSDAVVNLQSLRRDLATMNPEVQFSFREEVEPVYRDLVDLLLLAPSGTPPGQAQLQQARAVLESLKVAELENYFRSACLDSKETIDQIVDQKDSNAAVVYPIILKDRLALILKIPRQEQLEFFSTEVPEDQLEATIEQLQTSLPNITRMIQVKQSSSQIYDWLIRPIEKTLKASGVDTLAFALDGSLRNVPMAVLYDQQQQQYLVEKYAISLTPSLQLVPPNPSKQAPRNVLAAGINVQRTVDGRSFAPLVNVGSELDQIGIEVPRSQDLVNQKFTIKNLTQTLRSKSFSIVHIATHGEFSSSLDNTYLLTWDQLLKGNGLANLLQQSDLGNASEIELLVLSACQTAVGDERATLGLAGIAVQAGARSTLATLWSIDDQSTTDLMSQFYQALESGQTKAEALRTAQIAVLGQDQRPYFWAPYVLVGNWQ